MVEVTMEVFRSACQRHADPETVTTHNLGYATKMEFLTKEGSLVGYLIIRETNTKRYIHTKYL